MFWFQINRIEIHNCWLKCLFSTSLAYIMLCLLQIDKQETAYTVRPRLYHIIYYMNMLYYDLWLAVFDEELFSTFKCWLVKPIVTLALKAIQMKLSWLGWGSYFLSLLPVMMTKQLIWHFFRHDTNTLAGVCVTLCLPHSYCIFHTSF